MKKEYALLNKEYDAESLYDLGRDVHESFEFPEDEQFKNLKADEHGFLPGKFVVSINYIEGDNE